MLHARAEMIGRLRQSLKQFSNDTAWVSDHYTDEPVDAIISEFQIYVSRTSELILLGSHTAHERGS